MVTIDSLFHLVKHYHLTDDENCFEKAIDMAKSDLGKVLNTEREYPPFIYYLCLEQMENNPKYKFGKTFKSMNDEEKTLVFNETISELKALLA